MAAPACWRDRPDPPRHALAVLGRRWPLVERCDVLAVAAHPDDAELGCGATLARLAAAGRTVGMLDLTAGELATRGTVETRRAEAEAAAGALGVAWRHCLGLRDGGISEERDEQLAA